MVDNFEINNIFFLFNLIRKIKEETPERREKNLNLLRVLGIQSPF